MPNTLRNTAGAIVPDCLIIGKIVWNNPLNVGDTYALQDGAGNVEGQGTCAVAHDGTPGSRDFGPAGRPLSDFKVTQISTGTLLIYLL